MKVYSIPVHWAMSATVTIKAENIEEAIKKVSELPALPRRHAEYVDGSFEVNVEAAHDINGE